MKSKGEPAFVARQVTKVYHMGEVDVHALQGVDLELWPSELVVLLGPSGSGKSTLLNILGGLDVPTSGIVHYLHHESGAGEMEWDHDRDAPVSLGGILPWYRRPVLAVLFAAVIAGYLLQGPIRATLQDAVELASRTHVGQTITDWLGAR